MPTPMTASDVLESEFFSMRAKILELAALLDQIDRGQESVENDPRMQLVRRGLEVLTGEEPDRAARVQTIFSLPYDPAWREKFDI